MDLSGFSATQRFEATQIVSKCITSRKYFFTEILGAELDKWQERVVDQLDSGVTKISIRSGHGVGKTALCALLALHFLCFRDDVKIIVTSPSSDQMKDGLIPELNKWKSRLPDWMSRSLAATSERMVRFPDDKNNFISFRTARKENPEALAGVHATHVMVIVDEASGVDEAIYETGQGALSTEGAIAILIGNPTNPSGFFYKTHTTLRNVWWTLRVACQDSRRVSADYIMNIARTYGVDSREYRVRVLGEFPESGADAILPRAFVEAAVDRDVMKIQKDIVWGIDPGRGGDPTGFCERSSNCITEVRELQYVDLMGTVGWFYNRWSEIPPSHRPRKIYVDSIGLGAGVADRLLELDLPVVHVNVAESPSMKDRFLNLRAEVWYEMREWFESYEVRIDPGEYVPQFVDELSGVQQKLTSLGKVQLESKMEMKKRGMKSPNLADACALTFAEGGDVRIGNYESGWGKVDLSQWKVPGLARKRR